jgi:hypothetical protein
MHPREALALGSMDLSDPVSVDHVPHPSSAARAAKAQLRRGEVTGRLSDAEEGTAYPQYVLVRLPAVAEDELREVLTDSWRTTASKRMLDELGG